MSATTESKPQLAYMLYFEDEGRSHGLGPTLRVSARAVHVIDGKVRNPSSMDRDEFADFMVSGHMSEDSDDFYHGEPEFDPYKVRLVDAERMVKVFRRTNKALAKIAETHGRPVDFAAFLGQLAVATKAKRNPFLIIVTPGHLGSYDGADIRHFDVDALRFRLQREVRAWREKYGIVLEEVNA
jgi:hypothetical protein